MTTKQDQFAKVTGFTKTDLNKLGTGIHFFDGFIIVKKPESFQVFSNRCTHAGCRITQEINGELICPCHGSRFDLQGKVLRGPAALPLRQLAYKTDDLTSEIIIEH